MSSNVELDKAYVPGDVEGEMFALWQSRNAFAAVPDDRGPTKRFVVMIPLPNVTGVLHLGHAINNTLQDIMTRWHRMRGFNSLYQPGTDHAGIATQAVVERRILQDENKTRHDLGREELVRRIWTWKESYEKRIIDQLKLMGCSCDWNRVRFTLDDRYSSSVHETFFRWFADGLIYRGKRLVNWDTHLRTAVADDEVYHETVKGHFWHFKYPIKNAPAGGPTHLGFVTTRPETMLADVALAVNPSDDRYRSLVGCTVLVPLFDPPREIPVIADEWADPEKGTGCVKITPAHDANDYQVGVRHDLPMINMMTAEGRVSDAGGKYAGTTMAEARQAVVADMEQMGLLEKMEDIDVDLPLSDRSKSLIEPFLSDQWFVRMGDVEGGITLGDGSKTPGLAQAAIDAVQNGDVKIVPQRYAKTYVDWLSEKRDWCISRQLWWGHRIPVWTATFSLRHVSALSGSKAIRDKTTELREQLQCALDELGVAIGCQGLFFVRGADEQSSACCFICVRTEVAEEQLAKLAGAIAPLDEECVIAVAINDPIYNAFLKIKGLVQGLEPDPDVLDTWFSSQLWPYATLGWPEQTADLDYYYPGTVLITSRDIITLWVARMVLSGLYNCGKLPFRDVYVHPTILDGRGERMSKSKGNGVDPVDIIHTHGADALRYTMAAMCTETQDFRMPVEYLCPHCGHLTDQSEALKAESQSRKSRGRKLERKLQPSDIAEVCCKKCEKPFATQWANDILKKKLGVARETSDKFDVGRNFCNKLWNAARFAFMNLQGTGCDRLTLATLPTEDQWILGSMSQTCRKLGEELSRYRYSAAINVVRDFFWDSLCDWYIELTKARMSGGERGAEAKQVLAFCLDQTLRLLHPFTPFVTERLWQQLNLVVPHRGLPGLAEPEASELLVTAESPPMAGWPDLENDEIAKVFESLQAATRGIRDLRGRNNVPPKRPVSVTIKAQAGQVDALREQASIVKRLATVDVLTVASDASRPKNSGTIVVGSLQIFVHDISDDEAERARLGQEIAEVGGQIAGKQKKLSNEGFLRNAKPEIVAAERERLATLQLREKTLEQSLSLLQ